MNTTMLRPFKYILLLVLAFFSTGISAQNFSPKIEGVGISYAGELGLRPGIKADLSILLATRQRWRSEQSLYLRPVVGYFIRPYYTHNFILYPQLISRSTFYEFEKIQCYYELNAQAGLMHYQYIGTTYEVNANGDIEEVNFKGDNAVVVGLGITIGMKSKVDMREYFIGFDYMKERTPDSLRTNLIFIKLGVRFPLFNKSQA